jgi:AbrB family looped-hinge helix DNA binding protein
MYKATVTGKRQITIPLEICEKLKITTGNQVEFILEEDKIVFQKQKDEDLCPCCNELVYKGANNVTYENRIYHMECWYSKEK